MLKTSEIALKLCNKLSLKQIFIVYKMKLVNTNLLQVVKRSSSIQLHSFSESTRATAGADVSLWLIWIQRGTRETKMSAIAEDSAHQKESRGNRTTKTSLLGIKKN